MFTAQAVPEWYATLNRPSFNPPNWIFGPVWTNPLIDIRDFLFSYLEAEAKQTAQSGILDIFDSNGLNFWMEFSILLLPY